MDETRVMHAMCVDDAYHVERLLARGVGGVTELVTIAGSGPFVRKKIPIGQAKRSIWALCADCDCARLPRVEATYELPDEFVVVYDYVPGDTVEKLVGECGPFAANRAAVLVRNVCEAAEALHARGVVHRDITPANVVVSEDGAHLIDLGIARVLVDGASHDTNSLGTWGYAAPEQYGFAQTDVRSDVYSIGRLLAYMITGSALSDDGFDAALGDADLVPEGLRKVIERATSFEPSARYQSAAELSTALAEFDGSQLPATAADASRSAESGRRGAGDPQGDEPFSSRSAGRETRRWVLPVIVLLAMLIVVVSFGSFHDGVSGSQTDGDDAADSTPASSDDGAQSNGQNSLAGTAAKSALQVSNVDWGVASDGTVVYLVKVLNTSDEQTVELPDIVVTGHDAQGNVTFSADLFFPIVCAGQTAGLADIATDASSTVDVEAKIADAGYAKESDGELQGDAFSLSNTAYSHDSLGWATFTGEVDALADAGDGGSQVRVDVVSRNSSGKLVGYATTYVARPEVGESVSFQASATVDSNDVASYECYVNTWY